MLTEEGRPESQGEVNARGTGVKLNNVENIQFSFKPLSEPVPLLSPSVWGEGGGGYVAEQVFKIHQLVFK